MNTFIGIILGASWGALNLFLIKQLLETVLLPTPNKSIKFLIFTLIKFPLLYGAGYGLLSINAISPWSQVVGFSLSLVAAAVYCLGRNMERVNKLQ
jgi:hypothetical protein